MLARSARIASLCIVLLWGCHKSAADSPWLYGVHFYGDPASGNCEVMTGGKGIWSLEIVVPNSDVWWGADWQRDNIFNTMAARGHSIICRIEPQWGYAVPMEPDYPLATYLTQVAAAAQSMQNVCHIWQIGNEINLTSEWGGQQLAPADYVAMFKQIRAALKAVSSPLGEQLVLVAPMSPGYASGVRWRDSSTYLAEVCALLGPDDVDGFGIHGYGAPWYDATVARGDIQASYAAALGVIDHFGFSDKPVFLTEWNRRVAGGNGTEEARSAQFLHGAFTDLNDWNAAPIRHPVTAACWFIYKYDSSTWLEYSIEYLHTINASGADNDLFDAFQYACTQNYPSAWPTGEFQHCSADGTPPGVNRAPSATITANSNQSYAPRAVDGIVDSTHLWLSDSTSRIQTLQFDFAAPYAFSGFVVYHASTAGLSTLYDTQVMMLETAPSASGPWTPREILYNDASITQRTFFTPVTAQHVRLAIPDGGREPSTRVVEFELYSIDPGDFDSDGDVDLVDAAQMQQCFTAAQTQAAPACLAAHFDADGDVDLDDVAGFLAALDGPATE